MLPQFKGLLSPVYTPMHKDGSLNLEAIPPFTDYLVRHHFAGIFVNGSTGEFSSLTVPERKAAAAAYIRAAAGRLPVIVNAGSCSAAESRELAADAVACGADGICVIAPYYFRPATVRDYADFVKSIAPACGNASLWLYHAPGMTNCTLSLVDFLKIMLEEVPNFAGVKFTNENLCEFARCIALSPRLQMLFGRDEMLLGALATGARGAIGTTYNYLPRLYQGVISNFEQGRLDEARKLMDIAHRAVAISARYGLASIKAFMKFAGFDMGPMRLPANQLTSGQEAAFRAELAAAGIDEWIG